MHDNSAEIIAEIDQKAPKFRTAVLRSYEQDAVLFTSVRAFYGEPDLMYKCLAYAADEHVVVQLVPVSMSDTAVESFK